MEDNSQQLLPPVGPIEVPEFLRSDDWFSTDVEKYRLDFTTGYQAPHYTLSWDNVPFAPLGGIHAITGQSGNGKTMTIAQFMAAILNGSFGNLRYELSEEVPHPVVLYIDTEMEQANTIAVKNRVMTMCGRDISTPCDDFVVVMLREVVESIGDDGKKIPASVNRWRLTLKAIYEYKPTAVFIDGLLDVVRDFNDNKECAETIYKCMQVASWYNISVWCIVHQNPGGEKLVGHLGSFLERKVTDVIQTKKVKDDITGDVYFEVKQKKARGQDIKDWQFRVLPVTGWGMPEQMDVTSVDATDPRQRELLETDSYFKSFNWPQNGASYTSIESHLRSKGILSNRKIKSLFDVAKEEGIIYQNEKRKYFYSGIEKELPNDENHSLAFEQPTDDVPF